MPRVVHFELPANDPERAVKFYEQVFGWKIERCEGPLDYWLVTTGPEDQPGIDGGIMRREDGDVTRNTIDVVSVDEFAEMVVKAGGKLVMPKTAIPGIGYIAYCEDTEGNVFGIIEEDPSAE